MVSDIQGGRKNEKFRIYHDLLTDYESKLLLALGVIAFLAGEGVGAYIIFGTGLAECLDCLTLSLMKKKAPPRKLDQINNENIGSFEKHPEMYINEPEVKPRVGRAAFVQLVCAIFLMAFGRKMLNKTIEEGEGDALPVDIFGCSLIIFEGVVDLICAIIIATKYYEKLYPEDEPEEAVEKMMDNVGSGMRVFEFICCMCIISHGINAGQSYEDLSVAIIVFIISWDAINDLVFEMVNEDLYDDPAAQLS